MGNHKKGVRKLRVRPETMAKSRETFKDLLAVCHLVLFDVSFWFDCLLVCFFFFLVIFFWKKGWFCFVIVATVVVDSLSISDNRTMASNNNAPRLSEVCGQRVQAIGVDEGVNALEKKEAEVGGGLEDAPDRPLPPLVGGAAAATTAVVALTPGATIVTLNSSTAVDRSEAVVPDQERAKAGLAVPTALDSPLVRSNLDSPGFSITPSPMRTVAVCDIIFILFFFWFGLCLFVSFCFVLLAYPFVGTGVNEIEKKNNVDTGGDMALV